MKPLHIGMGVAVLVLAGLVLFDRPQAESSIAEAVERSAPPSVDGPQPATQAHIAALIPREQLVGEPGEGADVFGSHQWNPPPPAPPVQNLPPPAPMAPPLPFTVLGKAQAQGGLEVFLARGDKTMIVRQGDLIDGIYRVDAITPPVMTLTYVPLKQVQQLNIGVLD
jgi:hypothetical protein